MSRKYSFFSGANSDKVFVTFYNSIDSDRDNTAIYNIVGGPGTGKSSLMKKVCALAEKYGLKYEKYFCSSDPNSLDAVRVFASDLKKTVVLCDATAPHPRELSAPGAVGRLVDLSAFWSCRDLMRQKDSIMKLQDEKKVAYDKAYAYLKIAGSIFREAVLVRKAELDLNKLLNDIQGTVSVCSSADNILRPIRCISMFGEKQINNNGYDAETRYLVKDPVDAAVINELLMISNRGAFAAPNPLVNDYYDEVYFPASSISFSLADSSADREFSFEPYLASAASRDLDYLKKSYVDYVALAIDSLSVAKGSHFKLEEIYGASMDFEAKERYDEMVVKDVSSIIF